MTRWARRKVWCFGEGEPGGESRQKDLAQPLNSFLCMIAHFRQDMAVSTSRPGPIPKLESKYPMSQFLPGKLPVQRYCESKAAENALVSHLPLSANNTLTFRQLALTICSITGFFAVVIAFYSICRHVSNYSAPNEQKYIIRILLMVPIYAIISLVSYVDYHRAIYFQFIRDCYEAIAIPSFFMLMYNYIAPDVHEQKQYFCDTAPVNWVWPLNWLQKCTGGENKGFLRKPQSGLTSFEMSLVST